MKKTMEIEQNQLTSFLRLLLEAIQHITTSKPANYNRLQHWRTILQAWTSEFWYLEDNIQYPQLIIKWRDVTEKCLSDIDDSFQNLQVALRITQITTPHADRLRGCILRNLLALQRFSE